MQKQVQQSGFQFSDELNISFLEDLYAGDFEQALAVFTFTQQQLQLEWENIEQLYNGEQWVELKKLIHKLKPLFGYVGLNEVSEIYGSLENACTTPANNNLKELFLSAKQNTNRSLDLIGTEINRLTLFNA